MKWAKLVLLHAMLWFSHAVLAQSEAVLSPPTGVLPMVSVPVPNTLSGNLSSVGSDTLANLMSLWADDFNHHYPGVNLQIQAAGSSTAPVA